MTGKPPEDCVRTAAQSVLAAFPCSQTFMCVLASLLIVVIRTFTCVPPDLFHVLLDGEGYAGRFS